MARRMIALLLAMLPPRLDPAAPFPRITAQTASIRTLAPGVESGEFRLVTSEGPIVVRTIAITAHRSDVRISSVLAGDALVRSGETVSSMANRTGAVAGINADYFDIGNTNAPTNIVVRDGALVRTPRKRYAFLELADGHAEIVEPSFLGQVQFTDRTVNLDGLNEFPPPKGGVSLITPVFGSVPPLENLTLIPLDPVGPTPPFTQYRVSGIVYSLSSNRRPAGYYIAIDDAASVKIGTPSAGDTVAVNGDLSPFALNSIAAAVGGGPLLLDGGNWVDDPDGPNGGEYAARIPASGAALSIDGTLFFVEIDGRQPDVSVGVTRPEFAAVMRALGATRAMAFDGGGSSALAERVPGNTAATLVSSPSDSTERPVADGMFVYSTAPVGPAARVVVEPEAIRAVVDARVSVSAATIDNAEHVVAAPAPIAVSIEPARLGDVHDGAFTARASGDGVLVARAGSLVARIPIQVTDDPARIEILPAHPNVARGEAIVLRARAFDAQGFELALPSALPWRAVGARIDSSGTLSGADRDALVSLFLGDHLANVKVTVGSHELPLALPGDAHFMSIPRGGDGEVSRPADCSGCVLLRYALGPGERAAYLILGSTLPNDAVAIAFDLNDDGSGARVRVALRNAINEEVLLPATTLDHPGWRHVIVHLSQSLAQPARLSGIYVIGATGSATNTGTIQVRNLAVAVAGSQ